MRGRNAEVEFIREAIANEQYQKALLQWKSYTRQLLEAIEAQTLSPTQMEELRELYQWGRVALLSAQAHRRDRYRALQVAAAYRGPRNARAGANPSVAIRA